MRAVCGPAGACLPCPKLIFVGVVALRQMLGIFGAMNPSPYIVGITGGSASGKTTFLRQLMSRLPASHVCLVSQDNYYRDRNQQPVDAQGVLNFDTPQSIDHEAFAKDLQALHQGHVVTRQEYTFNNPKVVPQMLEFRPAPLIIVEGIFVFHFPDVAQKLDLKVFIDAKEAIKLKRRIIRDNVERGYDLDDVLYRYENHVNPTYERYIQPYKDEADIVIPNNFGFDRGLSVLVGHLEHTLEHRFGLSLSSQER